MKKLALLAFILLSAASGFAQSPAPYSTGSITATGSTCGTTNACISIHLASNVSYVAVTTSGTFVATLAVEQSADNGSNWSSAGTSLTTTGLSTYTITGMTDFRIRASAYTSGSALIYIQASTASTGSISAAAGAPAGTCSATQIYVNTSNGNVYSCSASTWTLIASGSSGSISSGTTNTLPKYTAATTVGNSLLSDSGTLLTYTGTAGVTTPSLTTSAANGGFDGTEGTGAGLTAATGHDLLYPDSTAHRWKMSNNNAAAVTVMSTSDVATAAQLGGITITGSTGTFTLTNGKTLSVSNTLTFTGTDSSSVAFGAGGTVTYTIANGTSALGTSAISSAACASVVTTSATGTATTDNIQADFNADPTGVTGYAASASGMLTIIKYPTANNVNFKVCNNTGSSITPGAITLNWRVVR